MVVKTCKQCGWTKDITDFRKYYGGRKGTYNCCLHCEQINSRYKYLSKKANPTANDITELEQIEGLYTRQRAAGLKPPQPRKRVMNTVAGMINSYNEEARRWLTVELTEPPEYYIDKVFDTLKGADKELRDKVLERFYDYEDQYYSKE